MQKKFMLALLMPIFLIALIAIMIYWPAPPLSKSENFLFSMSVGPDCQADHYEVKNNQVIVQKNLHLHCYSSPVQSQLYYYDALNHAITPVTWSSVRPWRLDPNRTSPGGFSLIEPQTSDGLIEWILAHRYPGMYCLVSKNKVQQFKPPSDSFRQAFTFLGWIK